MSSQNSRGGSGGSGFLAFIVGGLVVAVLVLGWMFYSGADLDGSDDVTISIEGGGEAAEAVEEAVTGN